MMGLGSWANGGSSSSSSNLSALAPPFTVDRSNPKPNSNPLAHFTEPPYGVPFQSSFQSWQYSHSSASRPDLYPTLDSEFDSIRTAGLPDYGYLGSHTVTSPNTHMPQLNPNVSSVTDSLPFHQYSIGIPNNCIEPGQCYPPLVSPSVVDAAAIPLVNLNEPGYDLLSATRADPFGGASQVDYARSLSGLEYTPPPWGSFWNRFADEEQGKLVDHDGNFCLEDTNGSGSISHKKYMKQGACTADAQGKCDKASAVPHRKRVDVLGRESQIVSPSTETLNDTSCSLQDPMFIFGASHRTSISGMSSTVQESHAQVTSLQSATNSWNDHIPYSPSYDKWFPSLDSCMNVNIPVKKSSPVVIRPPSVGTISTKTNPVSSEDVNSIGGDVAAITSNDFVWHNPSTQKVHLLPSSYAKEGFSATCRPSLLVQGSDHVFTRKEELSNTNDVSEHTSKAGKKFQLADINIPDGFTLALDSAKGFTSTEYSSDCLDHYNPAVDSPCWKGAPASRFSPPEASEAVTAKHPMKNFESCISLYLQQTQISSPCADDTMKVSCQNLCDKSTQQENGYVELGSLLCPERLPNANCPTKEHSSADAVKARIDSPKPSSSNGVQFSNDIEKPRKECDMLNGSKSDSDLEPSRTKQSGLDKGELVSERELKSCAVVVDTGLNTNDAPEVGNIQFHGLKSTSSSSCSGENANKLAKLHATASTPKMNVHILVDTIRNLSELLVFQCSNDASAVSEQDHEALKQVINNLNECVSKKIVHMTTTRESMFAQQSTHECRNLPDLHKGVIAVGPLVAKEPDARSHGQFGHRSILEGKGKENVSGKEVENIPDSVSLRGYADIVKDDNMVQAIKEVLKKDFDSEEETQSENLLYKNLWLEAEAALCSISYKARFNHMKIETEKCKSYKAKDVAESTKDVEQLLNSKVYPNPNITNKVTPEDKERPLSDNNMQDSPISSSTKVVDDVEALALARFHILKHRDEKSNSVSTEQQLPTTGFAGKRNHGPFIGGRSEGISLELNSQYCSGNSKVDKFGSFISHCDDETMKDFRVCATHGQVTESSGKNGMGSRFPSGWCDGSSSDWEHVLKDEFACQN